MNYLKNKEIQRGEIYMADLSNFTGSEQGGVRPVLILQNNKGNIHSGTTIIATLTAKRKKSLPTHVYIGFGNNLKKKSYVQLEQIKTIDKSRLIKHLDKLSDYHMKMIEKAIKISMDM